MPKNIGTARFHNPDGVLAWFKSLTLEQAKSVANTIDEMFPRPYPPSIDCDEYLYLARANDMYNVTSWASWPQERTREYQWPAQKERIAEEIQEFIQMADTYHIPIRVGHWCQELAYIYLGNNRKGLLIPNPAKYLEFFPATDYSNLTLAQVRASLNVPAGVGEQTILPVELEDSLTMAGILEQKDYHERAIEEKKAEIKKVEQYETEELALLKAEIERKQKELYQRKAELEAQLKEKLNELESSKFKLENEIFMLESKIYAIRCFAGEVVEFAQLRSGAKAPDTEPVVVHQKLHFLDEDLGRLASIYTISWDQIRMFEDFLKHSPLALETFAPNKRCISLVRMSRDGNKVAKVSDLPYNNMLEKYEYYHGKTVGIIIRNGENLYLGWTDEERIDIEDDLIISRIVTDTTPADSTSSTYSSEYLSERNKEERLKKRRKEYRKVIAGMASRSFVYNIVQGVVEHSSILPLPKGVTLSKQSEYVIYAVADKWVTDNRFGSLNDIIERCNKKINKGDTILTVQSLIPETAHHYIPGWAPHNDRGRGYANRTHDVSADDNTLYEVNLVEYDEPVSWTRYKLHKDDKDFMYTVKTEDLDTLDPKCIIGETYTKQNRSIFISLEKYYSDCGARSNFEVYPSEFINLQYMNSVWLEWAITTKNLGGWHVGGTNVNYAYAIRYLKTAMDFIRDREAKEKKLLDAIDPYICQDPDWPVKLSEWKLEKEVRVLTGYQAKRFAKSIAKLPEIPNT